MSIVFYLSLDQKSRNLVLRLKKQYDKRIVQLTVQSEIGANEPTMRSSQVP